MLSGDQRQTMADSPHPSCTLSRGPVTVQRRAVGSALHCLQIVGIWENPRWNGIGSEQVQEANKAKVETSEHWSSWSIQISHGSCNDLTFCADVWQLELLPLLLDAAYGLRETGWRTVQMNPTACLLMMSPFAKLVGVKHELCGVSCTSPTLSQLSHMLA